MTQHYGEIAFTPRVQEAQRRRGSRDVYARLAAKHAPVHGPDVLTDSERGFLAERDGFYLGSVGETGWPYVQYRGGPPGFLRVVDEATIGWADFRGNLQYVSTGNVAGDDRVSVFVMDYAGRRRLKLFGRARVVDVEDDPDLAARLAVPGYEATVERAVLVAVEALDWNCPQHITPRYTVPQFERGIAPLRARIAALEAENAELRRRVAGG